MAKGNLFLGFGRGKVGDVVFSRQNGEQVTRARNRSPRNPRTPLMMLQRVSMKTVSLAFSLLKDICDHSFQGYVGTTENQARFVERNVALLRVRLADYINSGDPEEILHCQECNFSSKSSSLAAFNSYQVSEGTLPQMGLFWDVDDGVFAVNPLGKDLPDDPSTPLAYTYAQICEYLGCNQGDQLTLMWLGIDDLTLQPYYGRAGEYNGFVYSRFILEPDDGDMSHTIADSAHFNPRNEGSFVFGTAHSSDGYQLTVSNSLIGSTPGTKYTVAAAALILSRQSGGVWQRSTEVLALRPTTVGTLNALTYDHDTLFMADAIDSYMVDTASTMYLNQAE